MRFRRMAVATAIALGGLWAFGSAPASAETLCNNESILEGDVYVDVSGFLVGVDLLSGEAVYVCIDEPIFTGSILVVVHTAGPSVTVCFPTGCQNYP